eukprot:TRINITY_DN8138_c0_g1_i2.p1 TRINITY_DN8138_c0_g1~~TRINITY_DN8138_c0_g1_i2.p1  ORF type:complete len:571 (-),score=81.12 TRINITY_DN8138_c0_g1_i2:443-2155(-)
MMLYFPSDDTVDWLLLSVAYFTLCLLAAAVIVFASRRYREGTFVESMRSWHMWTICECVPRTSIYKELQQKIEALLEQRQRDFSRRVIFAGCPGLACVLIMYIGVKHLDWEFDRDNASLNLAQGQLLLLAFSVVVFAVCLAFEGQPGQLFRCFVNIACMTRMTATVLMYRSSEQLLFDRYNIAIARICVALVVGGSLKLTIVLNALVACCQVATWFSFSFDGEHLDEKYGPFSLLWFTAHELLLTLILCAITAASERRTVAEAEMSIQAKADRSVEKGIRRLLMTTYDVVTRLSESFVIQQEAFELSAFLMHGTDWSARDQNFMDYLNSAEDRGEFEKWMQDRSVQDSPMGVPIYVKLRDGFGAAVSVEIVHSTFLDMEDKKQHLIGIREKEREEMQQLPPLDLGDEEQRGISTSRKSKVAKRSDHRDQQGTPARVEASSMDAADSDLCSVASSEAVSQGAELMCPGFELSSASLKTASLLTLLFSWNLRARKVRCCEFHDLAKEAICVLRKLEKQPCKNQEVIHGLRNTFDRQCSKCGLLVAHGSACHLCEAMDVHGRSTLDANWKRSL